jgi:ferritin-like metal-binding protein YciE
MKNGSREEECDDYHQSTSETELHEIFLDALADLLNAEQQLTRALPRMAGMATSSHLGEAIAAHLTETENHITRLEQVFTLLDEPVQSSQCRVMKTLIAEGDELMEAMNNSQLMDESLIATARKIGHHEMA